VAGKAAIFTLSGEMDSRSPSQRPKEVVAFVGGEEATLAFLLVWAKTSPASPATLPAIACGP